MNDVCYHASGSSLVELSLNVLSFLVELSLNVLLIHSGGETDDAQYALGCNF